MLKNSASFARKLNVPQGYASPSRIAAASLDGLFDHPANLWYILFGSHLSLLSGASNGFTTVRYGKGSAWI